MRIISKVAAIALVLFALVPAVTAGAQSVCRGPAYPCVDSNDQNSSSGGGNTGGGGQGPADTGRPPETGGRPTDNPNNPTGGNTPTRPANAPTGALPITGGDVVGMATIGAVAIGLGAVLVRRSKVAKQHTA